MKPNAVQNSSQEKVCSKIITFLLICMTFYVFLMALAPTDQIGAGELPSYVFNYVSMRNHFSTEILESDLEKALLYFPEKAATLQKGWDRELFFVSPDGSYYSWYFGTYGLFCIPFAVGIRLLSYLLPYTISNVYIFTFLNATAYIACLLVVRRFLNADMKMKLLLIFSLICVPSWANMVRIGSEMLLFALLTCVLVFWYNKQWHLAAFLLSIGGTLNPTFMMVSIFILIDYGLALFKNTFPKATRNKSQNQTIFHIIVNTVKKNISSIVKLVLCFVPFMIYLIFNIMRFGALYPQQITALDESQGWMSRFIAYWFDLNIGFLPFLPISLILFVIGLLYCIVKKEVRAVLFAGSLVLTVFAYSKITNINSGMTYISRYNAWSIPLLIFFIVVVFYSVIQGRKLKKIVLVCSVISCFLSLSYMTYIVAKEPYSYSAFSPIARVTLNNAPGLYSPNPTIFLARSTKQIKTENGPICLYLTDTGFLRKILFPPGWNNAHELTNYCISANDGDLEWLNEQVMKITEDDRGKWQYLAIPQRMSIGLEELIDYLHWVIRDDTLVMIAAKDEASSAIDENTATELSELGLQKSLHENYRHSYVAVIDAGTVVFEAMKNARIDYQQEVNGISIEITSAGSLVGNTSAIMVNGEDHSMNRRGLNVVVVDRQTGTVLDSVGFDTYSHTLGTRQD